jgi:hypothetical protein
MPNSIPVKEKPLFGSLDPEADITVDVASESTGEVPFRLG